MMRPNAAVQKEQQPARPGIPRRPYDEQIGDAMTNVASIREPAKRQPGRQPGGHAEPWVHPIALSAGHEPIVPQIRREEIQTGRRTVPILKDFQPRRLSSSGLLASTGLGSIPRKLRRVARGNQRPHTRQTATMTRIVP